MGEQKKQVADAAPAKATLTITEMPDGTNIEIEFSEPFRMNEASLVQTLALSGMDHMRSVLKEHFSDVKEDLRVLQRAKVH